MMQISHSVLLSNYSTDEFKMMWLASLLVLISVGGSYGDFDCFLAQESQCDTDLLPKKFPETPEELLKICRVAEQLASCIADVSESCNYREEEAEGLRHAADYMSTTCQEGNPIFEVLSSNLDCIEKVGKEMDASCIRAFSDSTLEAMREHVKPLIENEANEQLACLEELMEVGCRAMKFERHCGERVGEAIADVLMNFKEAPIVCTPEVMEEVFPLLEGLEDIVGEEMEQWLRKRR